jgi:VWFA-related protein
MRRAIAFWFLALLAASAFAAQRLSVEQLNRLVSSSHGKQDAKVAERLYDAELTERMSAANLAAFEAALPGPESRRALVALADQATFLDPPPAEIPDQPAPSLEQQREMVTKAGDYVKATLHMLPDLFARRDTIRYEDSPPQLQVGNSESLSGTFVAYKPLHPVSRSIATVLYRDAHEIVQTAGEAQSTSTAKSTGLTTIGEFGPILSTIFGDLQQGKLTWSHWERRTAGPMAVFRFEVPRGVSHYQVEFCCINGKVFQQFPSYNGELAVDPSSGTILRLTLVADLSKDAPIAKAELMVEYGPVELGGHPYYCPLKSVSVSVAPVQHDQQVMMSPGIWGRSPTVINDPGATHALLQTMLNETVFDQYHLFQAETHILTAGNSVPPIAQDASTNLASQVGPSSAASARQPASVANQNRPPASIAPAETAIVAKAASLGATNTAPAPATQPPTELPAATEISLITPAPLPDTQSPQSNAPGFSLHLTARLVDIDLTAYDKKGQPISDLAQNDFIIYDNGRKQSLNSFSHVGTAPAASQAAAASPASVLYSNRLDATGPSQSAADSAAESSTILLLDPTNLSFADLTHAREQVLKFLDRIPPSQAVGLYVRTGSSFNILVEETTDHAALASALRKWIPNAQDLARAQEAEMRNRQQFDTVDSGCDLQYVNGNIGGMPDAAPTASAWCPDIPGGGTSASVDPKMMKEGSNPAREAMSALVSIAAHMNSILGHKDLVWVASDNALADWSDQAAGNDKGPNTIGRFAIPTQEALNNAHVRLYPLDASQLTSSATDASLENNSVQLNPAIQGLDPKADLESHQASVTDGRAAAQIRQDVRAVQPAIQQLAQATGGRSFPRSGDMVGDLSNVIQDGHASYLLSFAPDTQPDNQYHQLTVTVPGRRGIVLRYRAGYLYTEEPSALKDRLKQAVWQPQDETEIGLSAHWEQASEGAAVSLEIAATDIGLEQHPAQQGGDRWIGKLDIFLVQRDETGTHAALKEQTLALSLKPGTYQKVMQDGVPFAEFIGQTQKTGTVRIIVVDENSGRMGSITLPALMERANP